MTRRLVWLAAMVLGAGCAGPRAPAPEPAHPVTASQPVAPAADEAPLLRFERSQLARADAAESQGRLAEAALALEVLALLQPDDPAYARRLGELRQRAAAAAAERLTRAEAAQRRGELDQAAQLYLEVLALAPGQTSAAEALRAVERERNRRSFVGRFSRQTLTRRAFAEGEMNLSDEGSPPAAARNQIEHATLLARAGHLDAAITLLRDGVRLHDDQGAKSVLADFYVQRAETLRQRDPQGARTAVNAALALDPANAAARALSRQLPAARRPQ